jgi:hypothetical protein
MAIRYDAIAKNGTYTKDGVEKNKWVKVGVVVDTKNGGLALKIEQLPVPFDGWLQLAEPKAKEQAPSQENTQAPSQSSMDDDIPF